MALQARAEATRQRILDAAVGLFSEMGYGETGLADVLSRAGVSKGAFYYHFDSKEAVATAIIEDFRRRVRESAEARVDVSAPMLDVMIVTSFATAATVRADKTAQIGNQLLQALTQISSVGAKVYTEWTREFTESLTKGLLRWETRPGQAAEIAEAAWAGVVGSQLLSEAFSEDPYERLANTWRAAIRAIAPAEDQAHYEEFLARTAHSYQSVG